MVIYCLDTLRSRVHFFPLFIWHFSCILNRSVGNLTFFMTFSKRMCATKSNFCLDDSSCPLHHAQVTQLKFWKLPKNIAVLKLERNCSWEKRCTKAALLHLIVKRYVKLYLGGVFTAHFRAHRLLADKLVEVTLFGNI